MKKNTKKFARQNAAPTHRPTPAHRAAPTPSLPQLVQIEKPIYGGAFLTHAEGKAVFVPLALSGEEARVRVLEAKRNYATAEIEEIVTAAPERVVPACRHFGICGGCQYQHADYATQLAYKQTILRETLERGHLSAPDEMTVLAAEPWGYRNRIRLAFDAEGHPGYRGRRSHDVVPLAECPIAAPLLVRAALASGELAHALPPHYRPSEISLFCNADETELLVGVTVAAGNKALWEEFAQSFVEKIPETKGIEFASESAPGELPRQLTHWGAGSLVYRVAPFDYRVDQGAFFQVNRWLVEQLAECVTAGQSGAVAWDLFAGVGLFARRLAEQFAHVIAVESAPAAEAALQHNLRETNAEAVSATTDKFLRGAVRNARPDLIVVDPPRTGLGAEVTTLLAHVAAPALVYVSCDPATLARDLRTLLDAGYAIESISLADLFPQTFHLETIVRLRAKASNS